MNIREALIAQSPSLALQRAAADEIAKLDAHIRFLEQWIQTRNETTTWLAETHPALFAQLTEIYSTR